jgi:hypothetical protein
MTRAEMGAFLKLISFWDGRRQIYPCPNSISGENSIMTATAVIEEIKQLPRAEQSRVLQFAFDLARERQLTGEELGVLVQRMVDSKDPAEVKKLREEIHRGFYGQ